MNTQRETFESINLIIEKVISEINSGKSRVFEIVDRLRDEFERKRIELENVKYRIEKIIVEVDELQALDKRMRIILANASKEFNSASEKIIRSTYEEALEVRVMYVTKQNEEKELRKQRDELERSLKEYLESIEDADNIVNQINIALGYLEGNIAQEVKGAESDTQMQVGIKILESQERERKRIAREIHDGPAQYIANAMLRIDLCKMIVQRDLQEGLNELDDLKKNVKMALREVRGVLFDLRPISLEQLGLDEALREMANLISEENGIEVDISTKSMERKIEHILEIAVYRLAQEILNNIKKHSKATKVIIRVEYGADYVYFMINDNGVGFDIKEAIENAKRKGTSYGLIGIFDRVNQLQGKIGIDSSPDEGTTYKIKLPVK
ncbi:MAG: histidine kinase [Clostridium sp.]